MLQISFINGQEIFYSLVCLILLLVSLAFPIFTAIILMRKYDSLSSEDMQVKIGSLYSDIRLESKLALFYHVIFMVRRLLLSFMAIFMIGF